MEYKTKSIFDEKITTNVYNNDVLDISCLDDSQNEGTNRAFRALVKSKKTDFEEISLVINDDILSFYDNSGRLFCIDLLWTRVSFKEDSKNVLDRITPQTTDRVHDRNTMLTFGFDETEGADNSGKAILGSEIILYNKLGRYEFYFSRKRNYEALKLYLKYKCIRTDFYGKYQKIGFIKQSSLARVQKILDRDSKEVFTVKKFSKSELEASQEEKMSLFSEIEILRQINHENIVKLYEVFEGPQSVFLVFEYLNGGEIFNEELLEKKFSFEKFCEASFRVLNRSHLASAENNFLFDIKEISSISINLSMNQRSFSKQRVKDTEAIKKIKPGYPLNLSRDDVIHIMRSMCSALKYLKDIGIMHRDIKPSNIMFKRGRDGSREVKLIDFGVAGCPEDQNLFTKACGTPGFIAPEMINYAYNRANCGKIDNKCDVYSMGIIFFILLTGKHPYSDSSFAISPYELSCNNRTFVNFEETDSLYDVSDHEKDLVRKMLRFDPEERITVEEVLKHPCFYFWDRMGTEERKVGELRPFEKIRYNFRVNKKIQLR